MNVWILYKRNDEQVGNEVYEINRFREAAQNLSLNLRVIRPDQFDLVFSASESDTIALDGESVPLPDIVLPRLGAGTTYYALALMRQLERLGVVVINSSQSIETVRDKLYTQQILNRSLLPTPKTILAKFPVDSGLVTRELGFPAIVKTLSGSLGTGVHLSRNADEFDQVMGIIYAANPNANLIIQEFISDSWGRDLRIFTIGGEILAAMQRESTDGGFKANISRGGVGKRYSIDDSLRALALRISNLLHLDVAGIDLLFDGEQFKVCEVNSAPQFRGLEACHEDVNVAEHILRFALKKRLDSHPANGVIRSNATQQPTQ